MENQDNDFMHKGEDWIVDLPAWLEGIFEVVYVMNSSGQESGIDYLSQLTNTTMFYVKNILELIQLVPLVMTSLTIFACGSTAFHCAADIVSSPFKVLSTLGIAAHYCVMYGLFLLVVLAFTSICLVYLSSRQNLHWIWPLVVLRGFAGIIMITFFNDVVGMFLSSYACDLLKLRVEEYECWDPQHYTTIVMSTVSLFVVVPFGMILGLLYDKFDMFSPHRGIQAHGRVECFYSLYKVFVNALYVVSVIDDRSNRVWVQVLMFLFTFVLWVAHAICAPHFRDADNRLRSSLLAALTGGAFMVLLEVTAYDGEEIDTLITTLVIIITGFVGWVTSVTRKNILCEPLIAESRRLSNLSSQQLFLLNESLRSYLLMESADFDEAMFKMDNVALAACINVATANGMNFEQLTAATRAAEIQRFKSGPSFQKFLRVFRLPTDVEVALRSFREDWYELSDHQRDVRVAVIRLLFAVLLERHHSDGAFIRLWFALVSKRMIKDSLAEGTFLRAAMDVSKSWDVSFMSFALQKEKDTKEAAETIGKTRRVNIVDIATFRKYRQLAMVAHKDALRLTASFFEQLVHSARDTSKSNANSVAMNKRERRLRKTLTLALDAAGLAEYNYETLIARFPSSGEAQNAMNTFKSHFFVAQGGGMLDPNDNQSQSSVGSLALARHALSQEKAKSARANVHRVFGVLRISWIATILCVVLFVALNGYRELKEEALSVNKLLHPATELLHINLLDACLDANQLRVSRRCIDDSGLSTDVIPMLDEFADTLPGLATSGSTYDTACMTSYSTIGSPTTIKGCSLTKVPASTDTSVADPVFYTTVSSTELSTTADGLVQHTEWVGEGRSRIPTGSGTLWLTQEFEETTIASSLTKVRGASRIVNLPTGSVYATVYFVSDCPSFDTVSDSAIDSSDDLPQLLQRRLTDREEAGLDYYGGGDAITAYEYRLGSTDPTLVGHSVNSIVAFFASNLGSMTVQAKMQPTASDLDSLPATRNVIANCQQTFRYAPTRDVTEGSRLAFEDYCHTNLVRSIIIYSAITVVLCITTAITLSILWKQLAFFDARNGGSPALSMVRALPGGEIIRFARHFKRAGRTAADIFSTSRRAQSRRSNVTMDSKRSALQQQQLQMIQANGGLPIVQDGVVMMQTGGGGHLDSRRSAGFNGSQPSSTRDIQINMNDDQNNNESMNKYIVDNNSSQQQVYGRGQPTSSPNQNNGGRNFPQPQLLFGNEAQLRGRSGLASPMDPNFRASVQTNMSGGVMREMNTNNAINMKYQQRQQQQQQLQIRNDDSESQTDSETDDDDEEDDETEDGYEYKNNNKVNPNNNMNMGGGNLKIEGIMPRNTRSTNSNLKAPQNGAYDKSTSDPWSNTDVTYNKQSRGSHQSLQHRKANNNSNYGGTNEKKINGKFTKKFGKALTENGTENKLKNDELALKNNAATQQKKKSRTCAELFLGKLSRFFVLLWICIIVLFIILIYFKIDTEVQLPKYKDLLESVSDVDIDSFGVTLSAYRLADPNGVTGATDPVDSTFESEYKSEVDGVSQGLRDVISLRNSLTPTVAEALLNQANNTAYTELFTGQSKLRSGLLRSVIAWAEVAERLPVKLDARTPVLDLLVTPTAPDDFWFVQNAIVLALDDNFRELELELFDYVDSWWLSRKSSRIWIMVVGVVLLLIVCVAVEVTTRSRLEFLRECTFVLRMLPNEIVDSHKLIERFMSKTRHT